jgi:hypothetical protein
VLHRLQKSLLYADDTVLMAESEQELQELVDQIYYKSNQYGLDMNFQKTKNYNNWQNTRQTCNRNTNKWKTTGTSEKLCISWTYSHRGWQM